MAKRVVVHTANCNTVGELVNALVDLRKDAELSEVMNSSIEDRTKVFFGFCVVKYTLSDNSTVLNFELTEDNEL